MSLEWIKYDNVHWSFRDVMNTVEHNRKCYKNPLAQLKSELKENEDFVVAVIGEDSSQYETMEVFIVITNFGRVSYVRWNWSNARQQPKFGPLESYTSPPFDAEIPQQAIEWLQSLQRYRSNMLVKLLLVRDFLRCFRDLYEVHIAQVSAASSSLGYLVVHAQTVLSSEDRPRPTEVVDVIPHQPLVLAGVSVLAEAETKNPQSNPHHPAERPLLDCTLKLFSARTYDNLDEECRRYKENDALELEKRKQDLCEVTKDLERLMARAKRPQEEDFDLKDVGADIVSLLGVQGQHERAIQEIEKKTRDGFIFGFEETEERHSVELKPGESTNIASLVNAKKPFVVTWCPACHIPTQQVTTTKAATKLRGWSGNSPAPVGTRRASA